MECVELVSMLFLIVSDESGGGFCCIVVCCFIICYCFVGVARLLVFLYVLSPRSLPNFVLGWLVLTLILLD